MEDYILADNITVDHHQLVMAVAKDVASMSASMKFAHSDDTPERYTYVFKTYQGSPHYHLVNSQPQSSKHQCS